MIQPGQRHAIANGEGARVTAQFASNASEVARLPAGCLVVVAEVGAGGRVRIASPAGWIDAHCLGPATPASALTVRRAHFMARHLDRAPGDLYGLEFPFSIPMIRDFGPEFLTDAFRAAGTIAEDNRVTEIRSLDVCEGGQASDKAFLRVAYARDEPGLESELFVKTSPSYPDRKYFLATSLGDEVELGRLSASPDFPIEVPRFYFGDYSTRTFNYILVTDRVAYGEPPIAPICEKGLDHHLPDAPERYLVLTRALARLVAAQKRGAFGTDFEARFPYPLGTRASATIRQAPERLDRLITFVRETAPQLFPKAVTDPVLLETFRSDVLFALDRVGALVEAVHADVDYTGFCHPNLNLDNAWFWRDDAGELHAGLLDWGSTGQMGLGQALVGMLMFPEPEGYPALLTAVVETFVNELASAGGPRLEAERLRRHYKVAQFTWSLRTILEIVVDTLDGFSSEEFATMADHFDPRLEETGLRAGIVWIAVVLLDWAEGETPGACARRMLVEANRDP